MQPVVVEVQDLAPSNNDPRRGRIWWAIGAAGVMVLGAGMMAIGLWQANQRANTEERNLLLLNQLKIATNANSNGDAGVKISELGSAPLPPPPPQSEPWMEELAKLPAHGGNEAALLQVPFSSSMRQGTPAPALGAAPKLIGVIQGPGGKGSAIFQIQGNATTSATVGEQVGNSGWILRQTTSDGAVVENNGNKRILSISSDS